MIHRYIFPFSLIFLFFTSCFMLPRQEETLAPPLMETPKITFDTVSVRRGSLVSTLEVTAVFVNRERTSLYFAPRGGYIKDLKVGVGSMVRKGQVLAELDTRELEYSLKLQELALKKAELQYKKTYAAGMSAPVDQEMAELELQEQRLRTEQAKRDLGSAIIRAPFDGIVVFRDSDYSRGDEIPAYLTLLQVADPTTLELMYEGSKQDLFFQGMDVDVILKDGTKLQGEVLQTPRDTPKVEKDEFSGKVFFRLKKNNAQVRRGMKCDIQAVLESRDDTLIIPKNLIKIDNGVSLVYVLEDDLPKERLVETGIATGTEIEIVKGLVEGDQIIRR